jgi:phage-related protein
MKDWNVGDTVTIYSEELDIDTEQKVMRKVTDALTGETIEIVLGNLKGSLTRKDKMGSTITGSSTSVTQKALESVQEELKKTSLKMLTNWKQAELFTWDELRKFSWKEVKNG